MKRSIFAVLILLAPLARLHAAEDTFLRVVQPADFEAAGLSTLKPEQLARLSQLVESYKSGALVAAQRATDDALAAKKSAEAQVLLSEAKVAEAHIEVAKLKQEKVGFLTAAKNKLMPGAKVEIATVDTTISGEFRGWQGRQIFTLANGQRWQVATGGDYYSRLIMNPKVQILPASVAGYWLRFPDLDTQVRVNLVEGK
jgi:hypothetical protein